MDFSIRPITAEIRRQLGAEAFDRGLSLDDHGMGQDDPALADWKTGWLARHHEMTVRANVRHGRRTPP